MQNARGSKRPRDAFRKETADPFQELISELIREEQLACFAPVFEVPPKADVAGEFPIGITEANAVAGINRDEPHVLVLGRTRSGKTTALLNFLEHVMPKVPCSIFETEKKSFRYLIRRGLPDFIVIPLSQDRFNPFCEPPNTDPDEWRHRVCDVIVRTLEGQVQQKAVLLYATDQLYGRAGVRQESSTRPTIQDLNRMLSEMMRSRSTSHEAKVYISRILSKTIEFDTGVLRKVTNVNKGLLLEELHRHTVVWEMHGLTRELTGCLLTMKMAWLHDYRRNNRHVDHYHINVFDEASLVVGVSYGY